MISVPRERTSSFGFRGGQLELIAIAVLSFGAVVLALAWIEPSMRAAVWSGVAFPAGVLLGQQVPAATARIAATPVLVFALTASTANAATQLFPHPAPAPIVADDRSPAPPPDAAPPPCDPGPAIDRAHAIRIAAASSPHLDGELCGPDDHRYYVTDLPANGDLSFGLGGDHTIYVAVQDANGRNVDSRGLRRGRYFILFNAAERSRFSVDVVFRASP